jgi:hypothetical protein
MSAKTPQPPPLDIQLELPENFTENDVKTAVETAISPEFVRKLHNAHRTSGTVRLQTKIIRPGGP